MNLSVVEFSYISIGEILRQKTRLKVIKSQFLPPLHCCIVVPVDDKRITTAGALESNKCVEYYSILARCVKFKTILYQEESIGVPCFKIYI